MFGGTMGLKNGKITMDMERHMNLAKFSKV